VAVEVVDRVVAALEEVIMVERAFLPMADLDP